MTHRAFAAAVAAGLLLLAGFALIDATRAPRLRRAAEVEGLRSADLLVREMG